MLTVVFFVALMLASISAATPVTAIVSSRTYTLDADFDEGTLVGVEHETVHDQLQLSKKVTTLPFIWTPNYDGTVSKVNTSSGWELGRYRVSWPGFINGGDPSRTTVDLQGNCYVGLRQAGTVVKIGLYEAGQWIDRNGDGICQTSQDTNDNKDIDPAEILPWGQDECVLFEIFLKPGFKGTFAPGTKLQGYGGYDTNYWGIAPRGLAIDALNNLWAGTWSSSEYHYIKGDTGAILTTLYVGGYPWYHNAYGAAIDKNGALWSVELSSHVLRINTTNLADIKKISLSHAYGLGLDYDGHLFVGGGAQLSKIDIVTCAVLWTKASNAVRGVVCTSDNNVWVAGYGPTPWVYDGVTRYNHDGGFIASISVGPQPSGVAVDADGKVWVTDIGDTFIHRIDPNTNAVDLSKSLVGSIGHYTYSDMTGIVSRTITTKIGTWTVDFDSGGLGTPWGTVSWTAFAPAGTSVTVKVRSSDDKISWSAWETAINGVPLSATPNGRYLQIEVTLQILAGEDSPILYDLTVETAIPELEFECFMTDSDFNIIERFDTVWTPKDMKKTVFKLASTNPGQFMWNMKLHNTWPVPIDTITINYDMDDDFILKGADPIQVHDGYGKTGTRIPATVTYGDTGSITIEDIAPCTTLYITLHMEYGPARDYFDKATMLAWKALHEPNIFLCDYIATGTFSFGTVTRTGSCSLTLPDPLIILAVEE